MDKKSLMDGLVREAERTGCFTGAWLLAEDGKIVSAGGVGWRAPEDTLPVQAESVFNNGQRLSL